MDMVVRRHKTLGAWVPVWVHGPCRNPKCEEYVASEAVEARDSGATRAGEETRAREPAPARGDTGPAPTRH
ncbi:hypothetical protein GCM10010451_52120 [Streptomyces virens]|uniref:Uncharacterized protein n=1 Tax=Streptomyces virens TaxID=285572 RepID=A0ABP6PYP3_9ACTN